MFFVLILMLRLQRNAVARKNDGGQHKTALFSIGTSAGDAAMKL
jgi:hypothetical protein